MLVDTHAHICADVFDADRGEALRRARAAGVGGVVAVGENLSDARKNLELADRYSMLCPAAGLYPDRLDRAAADEMISFIRFHQDRLWAIGEIGLDFWVVKEADRRSLQEEIFCDFISLSLELDLPMNVHSRSAGRRVIELLIENGARRVQLHAFDGKFSTAQPALAAGYYFSIPPSVVRSRQKQKLLRHLPLESLLVETDSPVLGAERNVRNEPANLITAVEAIAEIKNLPVSVLLEAVSENAQKLYRF